MPRLRLNSVEESFLEVTFTQREGGLGILLSLRVQAGIGRSSLVLRHECQLKNALAGEEFIQTLFSENPADEPFEVSSPFQVRIVTAVENGELFAIWQDKIGTINFSCKLDQERVSQFRAVLESSWARLIKRGPCS